MAVYTTTVRSICETYAGKTESAGRLHTAEVIELARPKIFDFLYPIFDESYKTVLETKILRHYYYKEIGLETVGIWQDRLETKLGEIMPYYNDMYKSIVKDFNPNYDCDWYRTGRKTDDSTERNTGTVSDQGTNTGTINDIGTNTGTVTDQGTNTGTVHDISTTDGTVENIGTNTGTVTDQGSSYTKRQPNLNTRVYENDTPQGALTETLDNNTYLSKYNRSEQTGKDETDSTTGNTRTDNLANSNTQTTDISIENTRTDNLNNSNTRTNDLTNSNTRTNDLANTNTRTDDLTRKFDNTNEYTEHVYGIQNGASYISMISDFRNQLINLDMLIINELSDLFMNIY